jgi:hypothetical protein
MIAQTIDKNESLHLLQETPSKNNVVRIYPEQLPTFLYEALNALDNEIIN